MNAPQTASTENAKPLSVSAKREKLWRKSFIARYAFPGAILVVLVGATLGGHHYWTIGRFQTSTDDAYVKADNTIIAPKVAGYVKELLVNDNQPVRAGQVLARIDDRDFRAALDQAMANEQAAAAAIAKIDAQIKAQRSEIQRADAAVSAASATLGFARRNADRRQQMATTGYGSAEQADSALTEAKENAADLVRSRAGAVAARQQVGVLQSERALAVAQLAHARALRRQAELNLSYTTITAPVDGTIGNRKIRVGQFVQAGTQTMVVVPLRNVYVVANFKETQLTNVRSGQPAKIHVDTFPGHEIEGRVDTLAPASGMEFSLLPSDNATGNFTKIVQRIPVKIVFPSPGKFAGRLRPGMSVVVSIDTRSPKAGLSIAAAKRN